MPEQSFRVGDDGLVRYRYGADGDEAVLGDLSDMEGLALVSSMVVPFLVVSGKTDLLGMTDADGMLRALGVEDAELLQLIAGTSAADDPGAELRRILAVHAVAERKYRPAVGILKRVQSDPSLGAELGAAVRDALAVLTDEEVEPSERWVGRPLAELFVGAPAGSNVFFVVDQQQIPASASLLHSMNRASLGFSTAMFQQMGMRDGELATMMGMMYRQAASSMVAGYQLALRFGNHRLFRTSGAIHAEGEDIEQFQALFSFEGRFDVAALRRGCEKVGFAHRDLDGGAGLQLLLDDDVVVDCRPDIVQLRSTLTTELMDEGRARECASRLDESGLSFARLPDLELPEAVESLVPLQVSIDVPKRVDDSLRLRARFGAPVLAESAAKLLSTAPRMVEAKADDIPALEPILEPLDRLQVRSERSEVFAELPWPDLDIGKLYMDVMLGVVQADMGGFAEEPVLLDAPVEDAEADPAPADHAAWQFGVDEETFAELHELREGEAPHLHGSDIEIAGQQAYLSLPAGDGPHPGVVVIHEWWGLNDHIKHWADRLAADGYAAIAVDLYGGEVATTRERARELMGAVDPAAAQQVLTAAHEFLAADARIRAARRGVIGWCFGGGWSLRHAIATGDELDAAVLYYGRLVTDPQSLEQLRAPLLGIFGERDRAIPPAAVTAFSAAVRKVHPDYALTTTTYDAEHAFANPSSARYDRENASAAWKQARAFLEQHLKGEK